MKGIWKKIIAKICVVACVASAFSFLPMCFAQAQESQPTPIDMYLIAGQSNAAGYSKKGISELNETFENVGYGGEVQRYFRSPGTPSSSCYLDYEDFIWGVKAGLGASAGYVGPEYGIAKAINAQYENRADGRKAFIFKTAAGGTSLRDNDAAIGTTTGNWGNWYPRSLWQSGYTPNTAMQDPANDSTGYLYQLFVENFEMVYNELKDNGYAPVVKGFAWMQGCDDLSYPTQYETLLKTFISDMREDVATITGDDAVYAMPFVIGKIATTFSSHGNPLVPTFNQVQQKVADEVGGATTVETSDLIIVNADGTYNGTDKYHFNCADAEILGIRFGEKLLELGGKKIASVAKMQNGQVVCAFDNNERLTIKVQPETGKKKYRLHKLLVNGQDVTAGVVNGEYVVETPALRTYIDAQFTELTKYKVTYEMNTKQVGVVEGSVFVYEKESATFTLDTKDGYEITGVTANGQTLTAKDGVYTLENVNADVEIKVLTQKIGGEDSKEIGEENNVSSESGQQSGCSGSILGVACTTVCTTILGVGLVRKKREE